MDDQLYAMSPREIARGVVLDRFPPARAPRPATSGGPGPRPVLEQLLRHALQRPPCVVAFSGGRDSSALLALATRVARREGLDDPLPVTRRFPALPETDETEWQERVVGHLRLHDWVVKELDDRTLDLIGPVAAPRLREHGVVWPPMLHADAPQLEVAAGGTIVDGEGGDQVFGMGLHRIEPVAALATRRRRATPRNIARGLAAVGPRTIRERVAARDVARIGVDWLRADALAQLVDDLAREVAAQPLRWDDSIRGFRRHRARAESLHNRQVMASRHEVHYVHPFLEQPFLDAWASHGGWRGRGTRTQAMHELFHDVLPEDVLERRTKARFNTTMLGAHSREFARQWDGTGVDATLVDPKVLQAAWLADHAHGRSFPLLQSAWLASENA